jgi:hypothetical protein
MVTLMDDLHLWRKVRVKGGGRRKETMTAQSAKCLLGGVGDSMQFLSTQLDLCA